MNVLHVISSLDLSSGGTSKSISDFALQQAKLGVKVTILTIRSNNPYFSESPHPRLTLKFTSKSSLVNCLIQLLEEEAYDLLHGHGLWQLPIHSMVRVARKKNIRYIITPHGMLEPLALGISKWKKKLALSLYQRRDLTGTSCIHVTAFKEIENIRKLAFRNPVAVVPNGIDVDEFTQKHQGARKGSRKLLFLSRIHPIKGLELLIEAWRQLPLEAKQNWKVEIAGNGDKNYIIQLNQLIKRKGLTQEVSIIGPQFGEAKLNAYHQADLFILPTHSENFGFVVAEALACGVPVITTKGAPWEDLENYNAGWWINVGVGPLVECLQEALIMDELCLMEMGSRGRKLVEENYSIQAVAKQTIELYKWVLGKGEIPNFVYADGRKEN